MKTEFEEEIGKAKDLWKNISKLIFYLFQPLFYISFGLLAILNLPTKELIMVIGSVVMLAITFWVIDKPSKFHPSINLSLVIAFIGAMLQANTMDIFNNLTYLSTLFSLFIYANVGRAVFMLLQGVMKSRAFRLY